MLLYNSFTANKETYIQPTGRPVMLYVCGVTPYDTTHVGHARTYIVFDTLVRYLRWQGADVHYCQNVTDVDDPLFERAKRDGVHWQDLAQRETERFLTDCAALNIAPPTFFPRASEEIATMIPIIETLVQLGHAYVQHGNVYFDVQSDPHFGRMARMGYDDLLATANERGNNPYDPHKRNPLDFVLWQKGNPDDPTWESPWGLGRPGWHIECSAMATRYLGPQIDIHGGGSDLVFPHHSCEIAQTEAATGKRPFSQLWLHVGMVFMDGEKMSKSLGNLVFVHKAVQEHDINALRWYLLSVPYREPFSYERSGVVKAEDSIAHLYEALTMSHSGNATPLDSTQARDAFVAALEDDLDMPKALDVLMHLSHAICGAAVEGRNVETAQTTLTEAAHVLGLQLEKRVV